MSTHKHQCGLITVTEAGQTQLFEELGCGHIFEHEDMHGPTPWVDMVRRHRCPECGLGPWYSEYVVSKTVTRTLVSVVAALLVQGCATMLAPDTCFANYDHISHPLQGKPFGPVTEEGTIDSVGTTCRWERGRVFLESGLSYMVPDSDLYGDDFLFNSRIAVKIWER